jgi:hypothetical protein
MEFRGHLGFQAFFGFPPREAITRFESQNQSVGFIKGRDF